MNSVLVVILSMIFFAALVTNMALKPAYSARVTSIMMLTAVVGGSIFYGIGYTQATGDVVLSLLRTPFSVIGMFVGKNDMGAIAGTAVLDQRWKTLLCWIIHLVAFYSIASAAMITIGAEALRRLRLFLAMGGDLTIIYGINPESIQVGKECLSRKKTSVVFIGEGDPSENAMEVINNGMAVLSGSAAVSCDGFTMKKLRVRSRNKIEVFALRPAWNANLSYALNLKHALEKEGVDPDRTSISLPGTEDIVASMLQVTDKDYGFGYVQVFDTADLAAESMIRLCPPWEFLSFDSEGKAEQDFECVVIGFGQCGQAVLRYLIMNGQFVGEHFHATVFSNNMENEAGFLLAECPAILTHYNVDLRKGDGRSREFFDFLGGKLDTLKYIAVCAGSDAMNTEVADTLMMYLKRVHMEHICVVQVNRRGVRYQEAIGSEIKTKNVYTLEMLSAVEKDRNAILLNAAYDTSDKSDWEKWVACDAFSKMSSRASAAFIPALIKASGFSEEEIMREGWDPGQEKLAVLGETEHKRWCAFHYTMGYKTMSTEIFEERAAHYQDCVKKGIPCSNRIAKDAEKRLHACLVPNSDLDDLSRREKEATGRDVDYRQLDINNILMIPQILRKKREKE